jgi:hypothetical protein
MSYELTYSAWHRSLGFSYFAMDLDYIEIREDNPVAIIESSLTTPARQTFDAVINRFLSETGGFQFDVAYWVSLWLNVPVYLICTHPITIEESSLKISEGIKVLNLRTGESVLLGYSEYKDFIESLPDDGKFFNEPVLTLPNLLEKLTEKYPSFNNYPYFNLEYRGKWLEDYESRLREIREGVKREKPTSFDTRTLPVKRETTGQRLIDYENLRKTIKLPYLNLNWVEWRKSNRNEKIGRPAAIIKTILISNQTDNFLELAKQQFQDFSSTDEFNWWNTIAEKMLIPWYFTAYTTLDDGTIGNNFFVWSSRAQRDWLVDKEQYEKFIKLL